MSALFYVALALLVGFLLGKAVGKVKLPSVLGYLIAGVIFGPSLLGVFKDDLLEQFHFFPALALSIVAFAIGSEMKIKTLRQLGSGIAIITLLESFGAFIVVAAGVYFLTGKLYLALILGALAPASAPAGTIAVLQEYKAKGRLTNALYAVVGLDDGLAIMIFAVAAALAEILFTGQKVSATALIAEPVIEIVGSIVLGCAMGAATGFFSRKLFAHESILSVSFGAVLLCAGLAQYFHLSLILANLALGMTYVNLFPISNRKAYQAIQSISMPVYIIFFFLAGANLHINLLPSMGLLGLVYVLCRIIGLVGGSFIGATISHQGKIIRNYLGLGILSQAGVAIGLAMLAAGQFKAFGQQGNEVAVLVLNTICATTIFFEIIGPIGTRIAISKAGEIGANVTEEDLIETYKVADVMSKTIPVIDSGTALTDVISIVSETESYYYPVTDNKKQLVGAITLDGIRKTFSTHELNDWLVALDIAEPVIESIEPDMPLSEALDKARRIRIEHLPVVAGREDNTLLGVLDCQAVHRSLSAEVLSRQQKADSMHGSVST
jgi:Kef-type K+ transport system membrane component KefB